MNRYKVVIKVKDVPFNGTPMVSDIEIIVPAETIQQAQDKALRSAEYYAKFAGKNVPTPAFTVEVAQ